MLKMLLFFVILYGVFIIGPSIALYFIMFRFIKSRSFENRNYTGTYYEPWLSVLLPSYERMKKKTYQEVKINVDGVSLVAEYLDRGAEKTAILFHGYYATPLMNFSVPGEFLLKEGYNLLLVHERAHGKSGGKYTGLGLLEKKDVLSWIQFVDEKLGSREIILWGISMGGTSLAYASGEIRNSNVKGLIIDCGFVSAKEGVYREGKKRHIPYHLMYPVISLCARMTTGVHLEMKTFDSLKRCRIPILFLHGSEDVAVPVEDTWQAADVCTCEKEVYVVPGAGHTLAFTAGGEKAEETVRRFLKR